ncbi:MAG: tRNA epoxyqueuosine(34) reductase QueG [Phycisphaerales bacterium]|nr:MAG: tRNA epoxyqueuosine(34) reductase QueG [Phycisphaerales bacterium]
MIKDLAQEIGFDRCGIARAGPIGRGDYLRGWLAAGRAGSMAYLHRYLEQRIDPRQLLDGAQSVIVVALIYHQPAPEVPTDPASSGRGRVAMYAWGDDYHRIVKDRLLTLADRLRERLPQPFHARACVDTAPLLEREVAAAAGIGWIGKNTVLLNRELGSYFFLGALLTTLDLPPDRPVDDYCGTCARCLEACPTSAFPAPYQMDASRCISYFTIEHRGEIPAEFHKAMGDWIFGCDACQEVCPYNRRAPYTREARFAVRPPGPRPDLREILQWTEDDYRSNLRGSAIKRARLDMLHRNVAIALQNTNRDETPV